MATNQQNNLFAPPTEEELGLFAPPTPQELGSTDKPQDIFAPPSREELGSVETQPEDVKPTGFDNSLSDTDIAAVASKYKVDPETLRNLAPFYRARVQPRLTAEDVLKQSISAPLEKLSSTVGGLPQKLYQMAQTPEMQKAIDELRRIGNAQESIPESIINTTSDLIMPGGAIATGAKTALGKLAGATATGAMYGFSGSESGKELTGAATGAVLGAGLGAGAGAAGKVFERIASKAEKEMAQSKQFQMDLYAAEKRVAEATQDSEKTIEDVIFGRTTPDQLDPARLEKIVDEQVGKATPESVIVREGLPAEIGTDANKLATDVIERRAREFASELEDKSISSLEQAQGVIENYASRQGAEATLAKYKEFVSLKQAEKAITEEGLRATNEPGFVGKALNWLSDNQYVFRGLDRKYGSDTEFALSQLNKNINKSTAPAKQFRQNVEEVYNLARKSGLDKEVTDGENIYRALDSGNLAGLSREEAAVAESFAKYFAGIRKFVNEAQGDVKPLSIPELVNKEGKVAYVPKQLVDTDEIANRLEKKVQEAEALLQREKPGLNLTSLRGDMFSVASEQGPVKELINAVQLFDNKAVTSGQDLINRIKQMTGTRDGFIALQTQAKAAMERTGGLDNVDFLLEKNLYKLARKYADNTLKHMYYREPLEKLAFQAKRLDKVGATVEAKYVRNLIEDMMGVRKGTMAEATLHAGRAYNQKMDKLLEKAKNPVTRGVLLGAKAAPEVVSEALRQIYPNVLGYGSIRAIVQNLTQPLTKLSPELGTIYGKEVVGKAGINLAGNWKRITRAVEKTGQVPVEFTRAGERAIAEGILRSSMYRVPKDILDGMGKVGMALFTKGEQVNRALSYSAGEVLARDLAAGNKSAMKAISEMPAFVSRQIDAIGPQNVERTSQVLANYLNDATMYNYNRASMSEFGRTMGPLFSTFSKWPTATLGDVVQRMRDKGLTGSITPVMQRYLEPLVFLQAIDVALGERNAVTNALGIPDNTELSDRQKKIVGSSGLSQSAPLGSLGAIAKGEIFTPPVVDAVNKTLIQPVFGNRSGELDETLSQAGKGLGSSVINFVPGSGLFRFLFEDLPTYATGEKPQGDTTLDRILEGIERTRRN